MSKLAIHTHTGDAEWLASKEYANLGYINTAGEHVFADTDWQDEIYRTGLSTDHNVNVAGNALNMPYRVSLGYTYNSGILRTSDYNRFTASVNLNPKFFDEHLKVDVSGKYSNGRNRFADKGAVSAALSMDPTKPVMGTCVMRDKDIYKNYFGGYYQPYKPATYGNPEWPYQIFESATHNPVATLMQVEDIGKSSTFVGNVALDYKIHGFEDLTLHASAGADVKSGKSTKDYDNTAASAYYYKNNSWKTGDYYNLQLNMYAQYYKDFAKKHHIDVMGGYEWQKFHSETDEFWVQRYPETDAKAGQVYKQSDDNTLWKTQNYLVSFFGRLNYSFADRYLLTASLRGDGSSKFSKGNQWGIFPSAAFAWKINEEAFLKNARSINDLKLRLGWGITGQQDVRSNFYYKSAYTVNNVGMFYPIVGDGVTYSPSGYNPDLTWEKTTTYNAGLDLALWNNKLTFSADVYYRKTKDLLSYSFAPAMSNFTAKVWDNIGSLHNQGIEVSFGYKPIRTKDWTWEINYNFAYNQNEIDEINSPHDKNDGMGDAARGTGNANIGAWNVGQSSSAFYVYQQVYDADGRAIPGAFVDRDGNGYINENDKYYYHQATPDIQMGLSTKVTYQNWDLGVTMRANLNNYLYNYVEANQSNHNVNDYLYEQNAWHNIIKDYTFNNWQSWPTYGTQSDYFVQNASFLKIDNITLGYSFSRFFGAKASGRAYFTAQNVATFTKYKGLDPEHNTGNDGDIYPRPFVGIMGLSLNF